MQNIFLVSPKLSAEDRLTAYWNYVLETVPGLGQAFVDYVSKRAGLPPSQFLESIDHPAGDKENRPDFLVRCKDYELLFEHKLDSELGPKQLERYLTVCTKRGQKLGLIAGRRFDIPVGVCGSPHYFCPKDGSTTSHFLWQDMHGILERFRNRIAREFSQYLTHTGLQVFNWAGLGDPLTSPSAAGELRKLYDTLAPSLKGPGITLFKRSNSTIFEIRKPFEPVHLINIAPLTSALAIDTDPPISGRVMALIVWVQRLDHKEEPVLPSVYAYLADSAPRIFVSDVYRYYRGPPAIFAERIYYASLEKILVDSKQGSQEALRVFVRRAIEHLRSDVGR